MKLACFCFFIAAAGCSVDIGGSSAGDKGRLHFSLLSSQCVLGCAMSMPVLEGSMIDVSVTKLAQGATFTPALTPASLGGVTAGPCSNDSCVVHIETSQSGDGTLEVRDGSGAIVDQIAVHVRRGGRIDVTLQPAGGSGTPIAAGANGGFTIGTGAKVDLASSVFTMDGRRMAFTKHGLTHVYANKDVVAPDLLPDGTYAVGATDVEPIVAGKPGNSTVTVTARGVSKVVPFRVQ